MAFLKVDLDKETQKQIRQEIFRPFALAFLFGLLAGLIATAVLSAILGLKIHDRTYDFSLGNADAWITFTVFIAISVVVAVVAYYRLRDEHRALTDDVFTPFRKELIGQWRVHWDDYKYEREGGDWVLKKSQTKNDYCTFGIDAVGKLYIESELNNDQFFENWKSRIEDIAINLQQKRLSFYNESIFTIRTEYMTRTADQNRNFNAKVFVTMNVVRVDDVRRVIEYAGTWYDLNGEFAKVKSLLAHQLNDQLPEGLPFPRTGAVTYVKQQHHAAVVE